MVCSVHEWIVPCVIAWEAKKGNPLRGRVNHILRRIFEGGLTDSDSGLEGNSRSFKLLIAVAVILMMIIATCLWKTCREPFIYSYMDIWWALWYCYWETCLIVSVSWRQEINKKRFLIALISSISRTAITLYIWICFGGKVHNSLLANNEKTRQKYSVSCLSKAGYDTTSDHIYFASDLKIMFSRVG